MLNQSELTNIKGIISDNGVICYPTEAVWGLGCHPQSNIGFRKILELKKRPSEKGVILIASTLEQLSPYIVINDELQQQLAAIWPGFITCLLPKSPQCPTYLSGKHDTIAVRLTTHPVVAAICETINSPLVSTSANLNGQPPIKNLEEAQQLFSSRVDYYVNATLGGEKKPSRIIQFNDQKMVIIRE